MTAEDNSVITQSNEINMSESIAVLGTNNPQFEKCNQRKDPTQNSD